MAFSVRNLSVLAYANGFTLWHYRSAADGLERITGPDYFEAAADMLTGGDIMMLSTAEGARIVSVAANPDGSVCAAPLV